jgi:uncharacterized protein (TIGR02284 family)
MAEKTKETILNNLIQLDIDAYHAYEEAINHIKENKIKQQLVGFQEDHARHIRDLAALLKRMGGTPIKNSQDFKGYVIEAVTKLRSIIGTESALKAMLSNETLTNKKYAEALAEALELGSTKEMCDLIRDNLHDEKRHYEYIKTSLTELAEIEE